MKRLANSRASRSFEHGLKWLIWVSQSMTTISKNNTLRQGRPMRLAHLAHITSIANQDATSI